MWLKKYFVRKGETAHDFVTCSIYNRSPKARWYADHTDEAMDWLWKHKMIKWSKPIYELGEGDWNKYIEYTKIGGFIRAWYKCSYWEFTKYYILQYCWWLHRVYYPIMIHVFGKNYDCKDYQEYGYE